jgi:hypothetical protein
MGVRYYQRTGKHSGISMPLWMVPFYFLFVGMAYLIGYAIAGLALLAYYLLRLVGKGGVAAYGSARDRRRIAASQPRGTRSGLFWWPSTIRLLYRGGVTVFAAARQGELRSLVSTKADAVAAKLTRATSGLIPVTWWGRGIAAAWSLLWIAFGIAGIWRAAHSTNHGYTGPIVATLVMVIGPLLIAAGYRRLRGPSRSDTLRGPAAQ